MATEVIADPEIRQWHVLYPIYFDRDRTLEQGRRVSKDLCIAQPTLHDLAQGAKQCGYRVHIEASKRHPKEPFVFGRIRVASSDGSSFHKKLVLREIGRVLPQIASENPKKSPNSSKLPSPLFNVPSDPVKAEPVASTSSSAAASSSTPASGPQWTVRKKDKKKKK